MSFRGLHSKCYAVTQETENGVELVATIAGVPKRTIIGMDGEDPIYLTREEELGGVTPEKKIRHEKRKKKGIKVRKLYDPDAAIENLEEGRRFTVNTGFSAKYVIEPEAGIIEVDGHRVETSGGCIIRKLPEKIIHDYNTMEFDVKFSDLYMEGI